jgi:hypothetical protein
MNELTNPLQKLIDTAAKSAVSKKVTETVQRHSFKKNCTDMKFILADISSSMSESVGHATKYELLRKALQDNTIDWSARRLIAFSAFAQDVNPGNIPPPAGNTALHIAIAHITTYNPCHTLIISDGRPDDEQEALKQADLLTGIIDILFIGNENDHEAISFMRKLAARSGGNTHINDLKKEKTLPILQKLLK